MSAVVLPPVEHQGCRNRGPQFYGEARSHCRFPPIFSKWGPESKTEFSFITKKICQMFLLAGFVWIFCQNLCSRNCLCLLLFCFCFEFCVLRAQPYLLALNQRRAEQGWLMTYCTLLPHMPILFITSQTCLNWELSATAAL